MIDKEFNAEYESIITYLANDLIKDKGLIKKLQDKREFGLKKYGDISFQANPMNAMGTDTVTHAKEEIIDLLNYLLHEHYKTNVIFSFKKMKKIEKIIAKTFKIYKEVEGL